MTAHQSCIFSSGSEDLVAIEAVAVYCWSRKGYRSGQSVVRLAKISHHKRRNRIFPAEISVAVFSLIEQQKLSLDARVFGPNAILGTAYGKRHTILEWVK